MNLTRSISALLFSVCLAASVEAQEVIRAAKLPTATLRELAAVQLPPAQEREIRHEERHRKFGVHTRDGRRIRTEDVDVLPTVTTQATIAAPPIAIGFPSGFSDQISPADATGAVSKTHVLAASNEGMIVHTRDGAIVANLTLNQFWQSGTNSDLAFYDPRVAYDAAAKRWVALSIHDEKSLMVGVSAQDDPTGTWYRYEVNLVDCDYSRLALTKDTIVASSYLYSDGDQAVLSFPKAEIYAGSASPTAWKTIAEGDAQPVHAPDSQNEYLVVAGDSGIKIHRGLSVSSPAVVVDAGFSWEYPFFDIAPVKGSFGLEMGIGDAAAAVYHNGWIYVVQRIGTSVRAADGNALLWWKVDPEGVKQAELGIIDSPAGTWYAYPSLAVNREGGMVISFCTFSATTYASSAFVYRDPSGRISAPALIRAGETPDTDKSHRWGDYTAVVVDPTNGRDFWIGQIYATRQYWGTWWAKAAITPGRARAARH